MVKKWIGLSWLFAVMLLAGCGGSSDKDDLLTPGVNIEIRNASSGELTFVLNESEQVNVFVQVVDDNYQLVKNQTIAISTDLGTVSQTTLTTGLLGDASFRLIAPEIDAGGEAQSGTLTVSYNADPGTGTSALIEGSVTFSVLPLD